jgi:hypothetical protein
MQEMDKGASKKKRKTKENKQEFACFVQPALSAFDLEIVADWYHRLLASSRRTTRFHRHFSFHLATSD